MSQSKTIEGPTEEIIRQLQQQYAGQELRVSIEPMTEESESSLNTSGYFMSTSNRPLSEAAGSFKYSVFFDEVMENIRLRREREIRQYIKEEGKERLRAGARMKKSRPHI